MSDHLTLHEVVCVAALGYEHSNARAWDHLINEDGTLIARGKANDTLIDFIILELHDIFNSEASRRDQVDDTIRVMEMARDQLERVDSALLRIVGDLPVKAYTLRNLVKIAAAAYDPDEPDAWDDALDENGKIIEDVLDRDTLANFIVKELAIFTALESGTHSVKPLADVRCALGLAQDRLSRVIYAFTDLIQ